ncbi:MAG: SDR family NAD(P)-dependent oxidoreductase [Alphaproteobacteria bacterium]
MQDLKGKTLFITGGASGIGFGITQVLLDAGMNAVIGDIRQDHIDEALDFLEKKQQRRQVHAIKLDITDRAAMAAAADETERKFGKVHVLINNAGVDCNGPFRKATYADWDYGLNVNFGGVVNGVQTFVPRILKHGEGGHIVSTASLAGLAPVQPEAAMYGAAKAAVIAFSEAMRTELAPDNIGVSVLCPGGFRTNIHESGQNRPERYRTESGFKEAEDKLSKRELSPQWSDPLYGGEVVKRGILNNELYLMTHNMADRVRQRAEAIVAAMPPKGERSYVPRKD